MTSPGAPVPDIEDEPVGVALKRMRAVRRMSGDAVARATERRVSQSTISRIERGVGLPDPLAVREIAAALGADEGQIQELVQRAERLHDRLTDWRPTSAGLASRQKSTADWESATHVVRDFQPALLPGLLQTSGYAKATLQVFGRYTGLAAADLADAAILAAVSARIRRQEALADRSKSFRFVITEAVLRNRVCPPAEMVAQLHHLRDVDATSENVSVAVIPDDAPAEIPTLHGFTLLDDKMVIIDAYNTGLISRGHKDAEIYRSIFETFESSAVSIQPTVDKYESFYVEQLRRRRTSAVASRIDNPPGR